MRREPMNGPCHVMTAAFIAERGMQRPSCPIVAVLDTWANEWQTIHVNSIEALPGFLAATRPSSVEVLAAKTDDAMVVAMLEQFARDASDVAVH